MTGRPSVFDDPEHFPGLTLAQPYGGAVLLHGQGFQGKDIETRKHRFLRVPSDVVICIGLDRWEADLMRLHRELVRSGRVPGEAFDHTMALKGVAVLLVTVTRCEPLRAEDYTRSLWWNEQENAKQPRSALFLENMRLLKPFRWSGSQGYSRVPRSMVRAAIDGADSQTQQGMPEGAVAIVQGDRDHADR